MYLCMYVCMYVSMYVCMYVFTFGSIVGPDVSRQDTYWDFFFIGTHPGPDKFLCIFVLLYLCTDVL